MATYELRVNQRKVTLDETRITSVDFFSDPILRF